jgi:hypothetical protein
LEGYLRGLHTFICDKYLASSSCCLSVAVSVNLSTQLAVLDTRSWGDLLLVLCSTFFKMFAIPTGYFDWSDVLKAAYSPFYQRDILSSTLVRALEEVQNVLTSGLKTPFRHIKVLYAIYVPIYNLGSVPPKRSLGQQGFQN